MRLQITKNVGQESDEITQVVLIEGYGSKAVHIIKGDVMIADLNGMKVGTYDVRPDHVEGWKRRLSVAIESDRVTDAKRRHAAHQITMAQQAGARLDARGMRERSSPDRSDDQPW